MTDNLIDELIELEAYRGWFFKKWMNVVAMRAKNSLRSYRRQLDDVTEQRDQFDKECVDRKRYIERLRQEALEAEANLRKTKKSFEEMQDAYDKANARANAAEVAVQAAQEQFTKTEAKLKGLLEEIRQKNDNIKHLGDMGRGMEQRLEELERELADANERAERAEQDRQKVGLANEQKLKDIELLIREHMAKPAGKSVFIGCGGGRYEVPPQEPVPPPEPVGLGLHQEPPPWTKEDQS